MDCLDCLQALVQGLEKRGDQAEGDSEYADAIATQVTQSEMAILHLFLGG